MPSLVISLLVFGIIGAVFLLINLLVGQIVRPNRPHEEKGEIYECGEQPVGSAWGQFDLRFYVVALLFILFDVEVLFFFPWAVVFGTASQLSQEGIPPEQRLAIVQSLQPTATVVPEPAAALGFARFAFFELFIFLGILLVGFAYVWRRGDLEWVRSLLSQDEQPGRANRPVSADATTTPETNLTA